MADRSIEVLGKVRKALLANTSLAALVSNRIMFTIPQATDFPYILISIQASPMDTKTDLSSDYSVRIQGFSRQQDQLEALTVKGYVYDTLHRNESNINLSGLVQCIQQGLNTTLKEPDGITWQVCTDYHLLVEG